MVNTKKSKVLLIIDTENYSGNFEREMCAFVTGQVGECGVGSGKAEEAKEDLPEDYIEWWEDNVVMDSEEGEYGCQRPVEIYPTEGWLNNGVGLHYIDNPQNRKKYKGTYPAYLSVAIFAQEYPPDNILEIFKERVKQYAQENKITLTGFRAIEEVVEIKKTVINKKLM